MRALILRVVLVRSCKHLFIATGCVFDNTTRDLRLRNNYVKWVSRIRDRRKSKTNEAKRKTGLRCCLVKILYRETPVTPQEMPGGCTRHEKKSLQRFRWTRSRAASRDSPNYKPSVTDDSTQSFPDAVIFKVHVVQVEMPPVAPDFVERHVVVFAIVRIVLKLGRARCDEVSCTSSNFRRVPCLTGCG